MISQSSRASSMPSGFLDAHFREKPSKCMEGVHIHYRQSGGPQGKASGPRREVVLRSSRAAGMLESASRSHTAIPSDLSAYSIPCFVKVSALAFYKTRMHGKMKTRRFDETHYKRAGLEVDSKACHGGAFRPPRVICSYQDVIQ